MLIAWSEDAEIVNDYFQEFPQVILEDCGHHHLERRRCVTQPEWHLVICISTPIDGKRGFIFILFPDQKPDYSRRIHQESYTFRVQPHGPEWRL